MTITMLLLTVILWGIAPIFDKAALNSGSPIAGTLLRGIVVGAMMLLFALLSGKAKEITALPGRTALYFILSGICAGALGVFTYYKALQFGPTSKIVPLASTYPLVTALLSILLLGESVSVTRLAGIVLIVAGVLLVK